MAIELFDPVGEVEVAARQPERLLETLSGRRFGCIFNGHVSALTFWKTLEAEIGKRFAPQGGHRIHKANTWAPAPRDEVAKLIAQSDYALVGVGA